MIELELGLALRADESCGGANGSSESCKKRFLREAHESLPRTQTQTLMLLRWDHKQPDEDDDDDATRKGIFRRNCPTPFDHNNRDELVGWPPVKRWRKRTNGRNRYNPTAAAGNSRTAAEKGSGCSGCMRKSTYVKVKMEGVTIARKIDLGSFLSFQALFHALLSMFECENSIGYRLIYRDREGDWLVAGDVPWSNFVRTAQLLRLQRING